MNNTTPTGSLADEESLKFCGILQNVPGIRCRDFRGSSGICTELMVLQFLASFYKSFVKMSNTTPTGSLADEQSFIFLRTLQNVFQDPVPVFPGFKRDLHSAHGSTKFCKILQKFVKNNNPTPTGSLADR